MIQPAAPSLLAPAATRSSPRLAGSVAAFALSLAGGDEASLPPAGVPADLLAGNGEDRQDGAAPGNPLPTGVVMPDAWLDEPIILSGPSPAPIETPAPPASAPTGRRSSKFDLPIISTAAAPPKPLSLPDGLPVEDPATSELDDRPANPTPADQAPGATPRPDAIPVATTVTPVISPPPPLTALVTSEQAPASSQAERRATVSRLVDRPATTLPEGPMSLPTMPTGAGPSIIPASALATSSLTPLDARVPASAPIPVQKSVATDPTMPGIAGRPALVASTPLPTGGNAPNPADHVTAALATSPGSGPATSIAPPSSAAAAPAPVRAEIADAPPAPRRATTLQPLLAATVERTAAETLVMGRSVDLTPSLPRQTASLDVAAAAPAIVRAALPANWQWAPHPTTPEAARAATVAAGSSTPPALTPPASNAVGQPIVPVSPPTTSSVAPATPTTTATDSRLTAPTAVAQPTPPAPAEKRPDAPLAFPAASIAPIAQPVAAAPAAIVFGAARFAAQVADDRDEPAAPLGFAGVGAPPVIDRVAAGVATTAQAPLDMRQEHWPHAMIERIEMIRDAADAADTRIRLIPDALGAIDVEVKRDGDTLNVRFHAEQAQTRTLLADAAPRLAEAAEARGLRLGQSSVGTDAGTAGQGQQRQPLPAAPPRAPRSPAAAAARVDDDDTRLA